MKETNIKPKPILLQIVGILGGILIILAVLQSVNDDITNATFTALLGIYCAISARA